MKKNIFSLILIIGLILGLTSLAFAAGNINTVTVKGEGTSKDDALSDALKTAVERAVGTLVDSQTLVKNFELVDDEIYTKSQGFVQDYNIINESRNNGLVVLTVTVKVNTAPDSALMTKLQKLKLIHVIRDPRIGVVIPEYHISHPIPDPAGETAVIRKLREAGFTRILDPKQVQNIRYRNTVKAIAGGNNKEALALATKYNLDYLIIGEAFSEDAGEVMAGTGVRSCRARVEAKLFKVDTGEIIATHGFHDGGVDITESIAAKAALTKAGEQMGDYMVEQLLSYASNPEKSLQILIKGVPSYNKVSILEEELKQINGVKNVYVRDYNNGIATIDLDYTKAPKTLAAALEKISSLNLNITEVSNSVIQASIKY